VRYAATNSYRLSWRQTANSDQYTFHACTLGAFVNLAIVINAFVMEFFFIQLGIFYLLPSLVRSHVMVGCRPGDAAGGHQLLGGRRDEDGVPGRPATPRHHGTHSSTLHFLVAVFRVVKMWTLTKIILIPPILIFVDLLNQASHKFKCRFCWYLFLFYYHNMYTYSLSFSIKVFQFQVWFKTISKMVDGQHLPFVFFCLKKNKYFFMSLINCNRHFL